MNIIFLLRFFIIYLFLISVSESKCNHQIPNSDQIVTGIEIDPLPEGYRVKKSVPDHLRIHYHYMPSFLKSKNSMEIKRQIMEPAKKELEYLLKAKNPTNGILRVDRRCINKRQARSKNFIRGCIEGCLPITKCLNVEVPKRFLKRCSVITETGEIEYSGEDGLGKTNVDIVILVSMTPCTDSTIANAASCFSEKKLDRPILGVIGICENVMEPNVKVRERIKVIQHEIFHVLGFSVDKFAFFRQNDGLPLVPRNEFGLPSLGIDPKEKYYLWNDKIIKVFKRSRQSIHGSYTKTMNAFVLPNVLRVAKEHFRCDEIDGVDLEDEGSIGSELTHFDEYFLYNEIMTPQTNEGIDVISKFTLALLEDSGWYEVDYSRAAELEYGKGKGCTLPLKGCMSYMERQRKRKESLDPFCDRVFQFGNVARCSKKRNYFDYCQLTKYNEIEQQYQYFREIPGVANEDVQYYMGQSAFSEYCPMKVVFSNPNSLCDDTSNSDIEERYNVMTSYFGADSMCFENSLQNDNGNVYYGASCQKYFYNANEKSLQVYIESQSFLCRPKETINFLYQNYYQISLKCPENVEKILFKNRNSLLPNTSIIIFFVMYCLIKYF